jgi:type II secretory pathway pseudopilin PulG
LLDLSIGINMPKSSHIKNQSGQAILIVLLIMAVILTIALSLVSRSVTDITITEKEEEAARAYSAAEAGVERALQTGGNIPTTTLAGDTFKADVSSLAKASREFLIPLLLSSGETTPVWFVSHDTSGNLVCTNTDICFTGSSIKACWGESGTSSTSTTTPAIEVTILYTTVSGDYSTARVARAVFDPYVARPDNNNFVKGSDGACTIEGKQMAFSKNIDLNSLGVTLRSAVNDAKGPQIARLRLVYNTDKAHSVGLSITSAAGNFPQQGNKVESSGTAGQATRKVQVYQLYPDLPPVFDYGLFSGTGGISK